MVYGFDLYKIASGHNNAASLALLDPQPQGIQQQVIPAQVRDALDGTNAEDGLYVEITYTAVSTATIASLFTQFGVSSASSASMTIRVKLRDSYTNYNCKVHRPVPKKSARRGLNGWRDITFLCTHLVAI
jgi:hypothetical protein